LPFFYQPHRLKGQQSTEGYPQVNPDTFGVADPPDFPDQAPTKKLKLTRRRAFAVFGAGALALGLPAALAAEPAREGRSVGTVSSARLTITHVFQMKCTHSMASLPTIGPETPIGSRMSGRRRADCCG
jgi:hypothetical protein